MIKIKILGLKKNFVVPEYVTEGAACMDLTASEIIYEDEDLVTVKMGFAVQIPEGYKMCIAPRSSITSKGWIMANSPGQIDSDYRGEIMVKFTALPTDVVDVINLKDSYKLIYPNFPYQLGDRVAQCWLEKIIKTEFEVVNQLTETERGAGGFGHTGK